MIQGEARVVGKRVVIAGGYGFIGSNLAKFLKEKGYEVFILTRSHSRTENGIHFVQWDGARVGKWPFDSRTLPAESDFHQQAR